ncbi:MAG: hypothetical protein V7754_06305 [Halioglobus sp.]
MATINLKTVLAIGLSAVITYLPFSAQAEESADTASKERVMSITIDAEITHIDPETRELTLRSPMGDLVTMTAGDHIERFADFAVGDVVSTTYIASLEGDVREPTEAEKAEPWVELDGAALAGDDADPGAMVGRVIQAVCTIEGMNRLTGTVMVLDPRGKYHVIGDVEPEKMEGVTLGTTVVLVYTEAMIVTLEKKETAAAE